MIPEIYTKYQWVKSERVFIKVVLNNEADGTLAHFTPRYVRLDV